MEATPEPVYPHEQGKGPRGDRVVAHHVSSAVHRGKPSELLRFHVRPTTLASGDPENANGDQLIFALVRPLFRGVDFCRQLHLARNFFLKKPGFFKVQEKKHDVHNEFYHNIRVVCITLMQRRETHSEKKHNEFYQCAKFALVILKLYRNNKIRQILRF
jgi:hypothetical protein